MAINPISMYPMMNDTTMSTNAINPLGYNPLFNSTNSMSDDFMAQQYFGQTPAFTSQMPAQPQIDTYAPQNIAEETAIQQGSSLGNSITGALLAGGAAGSAAWLFGTNPLKDGKANQNLIKTINNTKVQNTKNSKLLKLFNNEGNKILRANSFGVSNMDQYDAVQKLAKAGKIEDLDDAVKAKLPSGVTAENAKDIVNKVEQELKKIDAVKLEAEAQNFANKFSLKYQNSQMEKLQGVKSQLGIMADTKDDITALIKRNPEAFGITEKSEEEIAKKADSIAAKFNSKAKIQTVVENKLTATTNKVQTLTSNAESALKKNLAKGEKSLIENADKDIAKAFKNFKWAKTLKYAGIGAVAGLILGNIFGGKQA